MRINSLELSLVDVPLLLRSYFNATDVTLTNRRSLQDTPAIPSFISNTNHFDLDLRDGKSFDLYMFTGNITNGIVTVNG